MARQTLPINPTQLTNIKPREKEYNISDGGGLMLSQRLSLAERLAMDGLVTLFSIISFSTALTPQISILNNFIFNGSDPADLDEHSASL